jgi:hypothetical protein
MPTPDETAWLRSVRERIEAERPAWEAEVAERKARQEHARAFGPPPEWRAEPQGAAVVQKDASGLGLIYRENSNALCEAADERVSGSLFDDPARDEAFHDAMGRTISELRKEWRAEAWQAQRDLLDRIRVLEQRLAAVEQRGRKKAPPCGCK